MKETINKATQITDAILETEAVLFLDQYKDPWIAFNGDGTVVDKINSSACRRFITALSHTNFNHIPTNTTINQVIQALEAHATFGQLEHSLEVSIVRIGDTIWYDLGRKAVRITNKKWSVVKKPPIIFRRPPHQQAQVTPKHGGDTKTLLKFVNVSNEPDQILYLCWLLSTYIIPNLPRPILILHGMQGAGKSFQMQNAKTLIDHSLLDMGISQPKNEEDFVLSACYNYLLFYDNVSAIPDWLSDLLCKAVTGGGFLTRKLYSNNEVFVYSFMRAIIINGINQVATRPDLLDRSIVMQLERISPDKRKEFGVIKAEFEKAKPQILGGIFDTVVQAMAIYPKIKDQEWSRMADFDHWGCAIAEALGYGQEKFMQARNGNIQLRNDYAIEANAVGLAVVEFMRDKPRWSGTASVLYGLLAPIWTKLHLDKPKTAPLLAKTLRTLEPNLAAQNIATRFSRGNDRIITFIKTTDGTDGNDSKNG
jgi:hypothetical protein